MKAAPKFDCGHTDADVPTLLGEICYRCHGCGKNVTRAALDRGLAVLNMPALAARIDRLEAALKAAGIALLLVGCSGHATSEPSCTLEGDYTVTVEGCGHTSTQVRSQSWTAPCRDGDQCEPGEPSAFCAFVSEQACGDVWTTFERVEAVAAVAPEVCVLEGDYTITNLPDPGCGYEQTFPARVTRREVACTSEEQTCTPGSPSPLCVITKRLSETCAVRSVWELAL